MWFWYFLVIPYQLLGPSSATITSSAPRVNGPHRVTWETRLRLSSTSVRLQWSTSGIPLTMPSLTASRSTWKPSIACRHISQRWNNVIGQTSSTHVQLLTRMPFSRRFTICVDHKSIYNRQKMVFFLLTLILSNFDLEMTLTFQVSFNWLQGYRSKG